MSLVERVNTISEMSRIYRKHREDFGDEKFRRMLVAMEDVKAVLVKLADRVHNMRTLGCLPREKQVGMAERSTCIYTLHITTALCLMQLQPSSITPGVPSPQGFADHPHSACLCRCSLHRRHSRCTAWWQTV